MYLTAYSGNKYPPSWTSTAVQEIFELKSNNTSDTTNPTSNSTARLSHLSSSNLTSRSRLGHGVVAGIVVGCIAVLVLGAVGVYFTVKHRSRSTKSIHSTTELGPYEPPLGEIQAGRRAQELLDSYQDRAELPSGSRRFPIEIGTSGPAIRELSAEDYRSRV